MPYNEALAERVRRALAGTQGLTEKKMFGGIAFLVNGAMCIGVDKDDLIVRCAKDETEALLAEEGVREFDLSGGRPMKGWLLAGPEATGTAAGFRRWLDFARDRSLQPQRTAKKAVGRRPQNALKTAGVDFLLGHLSWPGPFGPAGKVFKEWLAVPTPDRRQWRALLNEGIAFVGR